MSILINLKQDMISGLLAGLMQPNVFASVANTVLGFSGVSGFPGLDLPVIMAAGTVATLADLGGSSGDVTSLQRTFNSLITPLQDYVNLVKDGTSTEAKQAAQQIKHTGFILQESDVYNDLWAYSAYKDGPSWWVTYRDTGQPDYSSVAGASWTVTPYNIV